MAVLNSDILTRAWLSGTNSFQQRIPNPAISSYANVVENLFAPMNADLFNEFSGLLNGLIGTYIESKRFENPLRELKKPAVSFGNSERHVAIKYLQAHAGRFDDETLLKVEKPEFVEWFYSVTEPRRYEFSWTRQEIAKAFAADGYGYDDLLAGTITQMLSSAEVDEMYIMLQMFAEADHRTNGLYRYHLSAAPSDEATAKELLKGIRTVAGRMKFPTMLYNQIDVPVFENPETLIVWLTPEVNASIDVDALSAVFQLDKADIKYRIIEIPEFPIPNIYAAITSEDFIYYRDFMTGLEPPFYNPGNRTMKYYYWANGMIGFNPAANCVLFTTEAETVIPTVTMTITGFTITPETTDVYPGAAVAINPELTGTVTGDTTGKIGVEPNAATYFVAPELNLETGNTSRINSRTFVDSYGVLHVQKSGLVVDDRFEVVAKCVYVNPSGTETEYVISRTFTVTSLTPPDGHSAKECAVSRDPYIEYTDTTEEATASE